MNKLKAATTKARQSRNKSKPQDTTSDADIKEVVNHINPNIQVVVDTKPIASEIAQLKDALPQNAPASKPISYIAKIHRNSRGDMDSATIEPIGE